MTREEEVPVNCFTCDAPMMIVVGRARRYKRFFCSPECNHIHQPLGIEEKVEKFRLAIETDQTGFIENFMTMLDRMAGPYALSREEWDIQHLCREQFGLYDPYDAAQISFVVNLAYYIDCLPREEAKAWVAEYKQPKNNGYQRNIGRVVVRTVPKPKVVDDPLWVSFFEMAA